MTSKCHGMMVGSGILAHCCYHPINAKYSGITTTSLLPGCSWNENWVYNAWKPIFIHNKLNTATMEFYHQCVFSADLPPVCPCVCSLQSTVPTALKYDCYMLLHIWWLMKLWNWKIKTKRHKIFQAQKSKAWHILVSYMHMRHCLSQK